MSSAPLKTRRFSEFFRVASNDVLPCQECSERKERYDTCFINWYSESASSPSPPPASRPTDNNNQSISVAAPPHPWNAKSSSKSTKPVSTKP
jgi:hypothetical protein